MIYLEKLAFQLPERDLSSLPNGYIHSIEALSVVETSGRK